jgi:branched-chain amino acid transport system ATP-binding protein
MKPTILETKGLLKSFGNFIATNHVDFVLGEGALESVIGPNGAGKTTFFNLLSGKLRPNAGTISFKGANITHASPKEIIERGLVRSFQISSIFPGLSVFDNILLPVIQRFGRELNFFRPARKQRDMEKEVWDILERIGLERSGNLPVELLSYGDKRRLDIGIALARQFRLLLLDEPTAGLNPEETFAIVQLIKRLHKEENKTILFIEHNVNLVLDISERITVLQQGRVIATGTPDEIQKDKAVREAYLGEEINDA